MLGLLALTMGLSSGFHCIGMCGALSMAIPVPPDSLVNRSTATAIYHASRIFMYLILGLLAGALGLEMVPENFKQWISLLLGGSMVLFVFFPTFSKRIQSLTLSRFFLRVKSFFGKYIHKGRPKGYAMMGALNGLLPCGMVYLALAASLMNGDAISSAFFMLFFGVGTLPVMFIPLLVRQKIPVFTSIRFKRVYPFLMLLLGIILIIRGVGQGNLFFSSSPEMKHMHHITCHP